MSKEKAVEIFSEIPRTRNCAQAVAAGFDRDDLIAGLGACGGGRAPEGNCGALHAALQLLPAALHDAVKADFARNAGALKCVEIKANGFPCKECVALAAELVEKYR
ncbi:MAG: hypothetical protein IJZ19_05410 [Lentisphaeria bacterium]|nr:hypothetical protein [Lentisphaeria bacterium]MBQ9777030.1 hypothetical protein [Lentisphaeria bacterium]